MPNRERRIVSGRTFGPYRVRRSRADSSDIPDLVPSRIVSTESISRACHGWAASLLTADAAGAAGLATRGGSVPLNGWRLYTETIPSTRTVTVLVVWSELKTIRRFPVRTLAEAFLIPLICQ